MIYKVGIGYDIHRLVKGRKLFIGGINIPYAKGLSGHSDGDVLLHAICDALLGALGKGDIGEHFPDTDPKYKNIPSIKLLKTVNTFVRSRNFAINNIDTVVIALEPKLLLFKEKMRRVISGALKIGKHNINIKAKTNDALGPEGRKQAVASYAVVSLIK